MIQKLERQYGENSNEYSLLEVGDTLNELIDLLTKKGVLKKSKEKVTMKVEKPAKKKKKKKKKKLKKDEKGGWVARSSSTGNKVYYILDGKKRWVRNPETLKKLGFGFGDVKPISRKKMKKFESGKSINLKEKKKKEKSEEGDDDWNKFNL